jgi:LacI family transcriptional regulator
MANHPKLPKIVTLLDVSRSYERALLKGIWEYANLHGPWLFLRKAPYYQQFCGLREEDLKRLADLQPDGIITPLQLELRFVAALGLPTIVAPGLETMPGMINIINDDTAIGMTGAEHLCELGLRNFAYAGFDGQPWSLGRLEGFRHRLSQAGFDVHCRLVPFHLRRPAAARGEQELVRWLEDLPKPVGLMACNDEFALSLCELCRCSELHVPDEVAILGVDNDEVLCEMSSPPLSSIAILAQHAGHEAARLLDLRLREKKSSCGEMVIARPSHVVRRQSTDMMTVDDPEVAETLRFIRQNMHRTIQVADLLEHLQISRRILERRFKQLLGRSPHEEILRVRVEKVKQLLASSHLTLPDIAERVGFAHFEYMSVMFRKATGQTPGQYRRQFRR